MLRTSLLPVCLLCLSCAGQARAGDAPSPAIWSGLVLATNDAHPTQAPVRLRKYAGKLKNIFGYNQFELIGEYGEKMDAPTERMLTPSKDFTLSVKTRNEPGARYPTRVVLFQNHRRLAELETRLSRDSPLFIRGPLYAHGQLVIVLHVVDASELPPPPPPARPPLIMTNPSPILLAAPLKEKQRPLPIPATAGVAPANRLTPIPADHFGPSPADHFGPNSPDRFGPGPRGGDFGGKFNKP